MEKHVSDVQGAVNAASGSSTAARDRSRSPVRQPPSPLKKMTQEEGPVRSLVKVQVLQVGQAIDYFGKYGIAKQRKVVLADEGHAARCTFYTYVPEMVQEGASLVMWGHSVENGALQCRYTTKFARTHPVFVPERLKAEGLALMNSPVAPFRPIKQHLDMRISPNQKHTQVSVKGVVTTVTVVRQTKMGDVQEITLTDESGSMVVALWRETAALDINLSQRLEFWDCHLRANTFHKRNVLNVYQSFSVVFQKPESCQGRRQISGRRAPTAERDVATATNRARAYHRKQAAAHTST